MSQPFILTKKPITFLPRRALVKERAYVLPVDRTLIVRLSIITILTLIGFTVAYIFITNSIVGSIYQLKEYKDNIVILREENRVLEIQAAQIRSTANLEVLAGGLEMVELGEVDYLRTGAASVALEPQ